MSFDYHTFVDGKGYRFTLPSLGLPDPAGEWVEVRGAVTTNQLDPLDALKVIEGQHSAQSVPSEDVTMVKVKHEGATWMLPLLAHEGKEDPQCFSVRVQRGPVDGNDSEEGPSTPMRLNTPSTPSTSQAPSTRSASPTASISDTSLHAMSLDLEDTASVSTLSQLSSTESEGEGDGRSSSSRTRAPPRSQPNAAGTAASDCSDRMCTNCADALGPMRLNFRYNPNLAWGLEFAEAVTHIQYVDVLPTVPAVPRRELRRIFGSSPPNWTIDPHRRTLFHLPVSPPQIRAMVWLALTTPSVGYACTVRGSVVGTNFGMPQDTLFKSPSRQLSSGPALLKIEPVTGNYACQPTGASAEVSYFLNNFKLIVEQNGRRFPAVEPLAKYVNMSEEILLGFLGQCASAEGSPGRMVFCARPPPIDGAIESYNVGVRLRDGGARFPIITRGNRKRLAMPGTPLLHGMHGDIALLSQMNSSPLFNGNQVREINLRMPVPVGQQDILFRVEHVPNGYYNVLQYAFRPVGSLPRVEESEYRDVEVQHMEQWAVEFLLNMARITVGVDELAIFE